MIDVSDFSFIHLMGIFLLWKKSKEHEERPTCLSDVFDGWGSDISQSILLIKNGPFTQAENECENSIFNHPEGLSNSSIDCFVFLRQWMTCFLCAGPQCLIKMYFKASQTSSLVLHINSNYIEDLLTYYLAIFFSKTIWKWKKKLGPPESANIEDPQRKSPTLQLNSRLLRRTELRLFSKVCSDIKCVQ